MRDRILSVVVAFVGGAIIAIIATVVHATAFPLLSITTLAVVGLFLAALRLLFEERIVTVAGALGVLLTVLILSQRSAGGSVLIAADLAGNIWVLGSALLCGLAVAWPNVAARQQS